MSVEKNKISVCVPSYERAGMLEQLINSFLHQDYELKEIVICDDSKTNSVKEMISTKFDNIKNILYIKNEDNLGYSKNLLKCLESCNGEYILIMGDDDLFCSKSTLSKYVEVFNQNPKVNYIYSNQIQFSNELKTELVFSFFEKDTYFKSGKDSLVKMWLTSIFIPGIGLRNTKDFSAYYPTDSLLFPQLLLIGHLLNKYDSYAISEVLIAGRAHSEQLGFKAIQKKNIKQNERHGTVEILEIFDVLKEEYGIKFPKEIIEETLVKAFSTSILKEKMVTGNERMSENYNNFIKVSKVAKSSFKLKLSFLVAYILPVFILYLIKYLFYSLIKIKDIQKYQIFDNQISLLSSPIKKYKEYKEPETYPEFGSIMSIVKEVTKKNALVLDVGCSEGYLAKYLKNSKVYGLDYNEKAIQEAKKVCVDAKVIDLNNLDLLPETIFDGKKFDYIIFADILEHVLFPEEVLKYFKKFLKDDGRIIISLPNVALWRIRINLLFGSFDYTEYGVLDSTHLHLYTFDSVPELIKNSGLKLEKIYGAANLLGVIVRKLPVLERLLSIQIISVSKKN